MKLDIEITDALCADILCTALEGGIGYWAEADDIRQSGDPWQYVSCVLTDSEGEEGWKHLIDYNQIRLGVEWLLKPESVCTGTTKASAKAAVCRDDAGFIDAGDADAIIQFACFGEIVYG